VNAVLRARAREAPSVPGVYCVLGDDDELIYIGKAVDLRRRLSGWAHGTANLEDVRVHRLVDAVRDVRWIECTDEREALRREADLIVALRPRHNASMRLDAYTFISLDEAAPGRVRLRLTEDSSSGGRLYGAFPHLGKGKASWRAVRTNGGFSALLRLLWVAFAEPHRRYRIPSKLRGTSPPTAHEVPLAHPDGDRVRAELRDFLGGRSPRLLRALAATTRDDALPAFMRSPLTDDLQSADGFFRLGPQALRALAGRHGLRPGPVDDATFAAMLSQELRDAIGDFRMPSGPVRARSRSAGRRRLLADAAPGYDRPAHDTV
jgi:predicted GIY-YIG superfamily endonuclease